MRISSGASKRYEKPRSATSNCGDDTPRSKRAPANEPIPSSATTRDTASKRACRRVARSRRPESRSVVDAAESAMLSWSIPKRDTDGCADKMATECPAPPNVASRNTPSFMLANTDKMSFNITGSCENVFMRTSPSAPGSLPDSKCRPDLSPVRARWQRAELELTTVPSGRLPEAVGHWTVDKTFEASTITRPLQRSFRCLHQCCARDDLVPRSRLGRKNLPRSLLHPTKFLRIRATSRRW